MKFFKLCTPSKKYSQASGVLVERSRRTRLQAAASYFAVKILDRALVTVLRRLCTSAMVSNVLSSDSAAESAPLISVPVDSELIKNKKKKHTTNPHLCGQRTAEEGKRKK